MFIETTKAQTFRFWGGIRNILKSVKEGAEDRDGGVQLGLQGGTLGLEGGEKGEGALDIIKNEYGVSVVNVTPRRGSIL